MRMHRTAERLAQVASLSLAMFSFSSGHSFDPDGPELARDTPLSKLLTLQSGAGVLIDSRPQSLASGVVSVVNDKNFTHALFVSSWVDNPASAFTGESTNINISFGVVNSLGKIKYTPTLSLSSSVSPETSLARIVNKVVGEKGFFVSGASAYALFDARFDPTLKNDQKSNGEVIVQFMNEAGVSFKGIYPKETTVQVSQVNDVAVIVSPRLFKKIDGSEESSTHIQVVSSAGKVLKDGEVKGFGVPDGWTKSGQMIFSGGNSTEHMTSHVLNLSTFEVTSQFAETDRFTEKPAQPASLFMSQGFLHETGVQGQKVEVSLPDSVSIFLEGSKNSVRGGVVSVNPDGTAVFAGTTKISVEQLNAYEQRKSEYTAALQYAQDVSKALDRLTNGDTDVIPSADELKSKLAAQGVSEDVLAKFSVLEYQSPINDPGTPVLSIDAGGKRIVICADGSRKVTSI